MTVLVLERFKLLAILLTVKSPFFIGFMIVRAEVGRREGYRSMATPMCVLKHGLARVSCKSAIISAEKLSLYDRTGHHIEPDPGVPTLGLGKRYFKIFLAPRDGLVAGLVYGKLQSDVAFTSSQGTQLL